MRSALVPALGLLLSLATVSPRAMAQTKVQTPPSPLPPPPAGQTQVAPLKPKVHAWKPAKKKVVVDHPGWPRATYPGFEMTPDGGSRVFVAVEAKVDVTDATVASEPMHLVYHLPGVAAEAHTNRLPLVTAYFATPVGKVQLVAQNDGVDFVIDLRAAAKASYQVVERDGGMVLVVQFPKVDGLAKAPPPRQPRQSEDTFADQDR